MTHLRYESLVRVEADDAVIATLVRKGWEVFTPDPVPESIAIPQSVTARQIRLWLVSHGVSLAAVDAAIDAITDATQREMVRVEWEYAPYVERSHPMLVPLASALGLTAAQVDAAFGEAAAL